MATNTTTSRPDDSPLMSETGGLSGKPLKSRSTEVIRLIADHTTENGPSLELEALLILMMLGRR